MEKIFLRTWRPYAWIIALGFILYAQTLFFGLVYLDDNAIILDSFHSISVLSNIFHAFGQNIFPAFGTFYRPVSIIPYILDARIGGTGPFVYHLTNVLLHLLASCLLYAFLVKLKYKDVAAFIFALLFTVHPALTSAVAWIPGRIDPLLTAFVLLDFIVFLEYLETRRWLYYFLNILFFALALFTKETALVLVLMFLLYYYLIYKEKAGFPNVNKGLLAAGWFFVSLVWFLLRRIVLAGTIPLKLFDTLGAMFNLPALILYTGKMILPFNLSVLPILQDSSLIYGFIALVIIIILLVFTKNRRYGHIIFGASWFILFLLPSLVFSDLARFTGVALYEHRIYLPMIGSMILLLETDLIRNNIDLHKKSLALCVLAIIAFSVMTFIHSGHYKNRLSFWESAAKTSPRHPLAHRNLGAMYYLDGMPDKAEIEYQKALELNPYEPMAHNNLALIYMDRNSLKEAEDEFLKEIAINPDYDNVHYNLGVLYHKEGRLKEAEAQWKRTLQINPDFLDAYRCLAVYYYGQKQYELARHYVGELQKRGVQIDLR
jgi:protein O-mannosyl-transferase